MMKKKIVIGIVSVLCLVVVGVSFYLYGVINAPWYTSYQGPEVIRNESRIQLHFTTLDTLEMHCANLAKSPLYNDVAQPVLKRMPELRAMLKVLEDVPSDIQVDFISMIHHTPYSPDIEFDKAVVACQTNIANHLQETSYDVIGKESSWSNVVDSNTLLYENLEGLRREDYEIKAETIDKVKLLLLQALPYEGVMQYKSSHPQARVTGIEDEDVYYLHERVNEVMRTTDNFSLQVYMSKIDKNLVWLRSEIALAKLVTYLKSQNLKKGVVIMGQNHRFQFELLSNKIGLRNEQINLAPKKFQSDEAM